MSNNHHQELRHKISILLCLLCLVPAMAFAQSGIKLSVTNAPLKQVLESISSQSSFNFVYTDEIKVDSYKVSVESNNESVATLFTKVFSPIGIDYRLKGNQVVLFLQKKTESSASLPAKLVQKVYGIVSETGTGSPLAGASVQNLNNKKYSMADNQGYYSVEAQTGDVLQIDYVGMQTAKIVVGKANQVNISLKADPIALEDVVVTGYQTLSKERSTGSYAVVTSQKIENKLQPSIKSILEGQSAGVVLTKDGSIEIRGVSTINGVKDPLIVVDGYPLIGNGVGIESVNPDNIENITVLKDAVAASIYGARASNGVIVITTKSAKRGTFSLSYKGTYSITMKPDLAKLNLASVSDYMDAEADLYSQNPNTYLTNYNRYYKLSDYIYLLLAKDKGYLSEDEANSRIAKLKNNNALEQIQKYLIRPKQSQQHNIALSSSNENNIFNASLRFSKEYGNLDNNDDSRFIFDVSNTWKPNKWLSLRTFSNINYVESEATVEQYSTLTEFGSSSKIYPYTELYDDSGNAVPWSPVGQRRLSTYETYSGMKSVTYHPSTDMSLNMTNTSNLQVRIGGDLNANIGKYLKGSVGGEWIKGASTSRTVYDAESFVMRTAYNDATSATNATKHYIPEGGMINENRGTVMSWVVRGQLNYDHSFCNDRHRLSAIIGTEISRDTYEYSYMPTRLGYNKLSASYNSGFYASDYKNNTGNMKGDMLFGNYPTYLSSYMLSYGSNYAVRDNRFVSWYGNGSYEFNKKLILTGSVRLDLTNFFGTDPKYRYKPTWSVGGTYKMAEEEYFSGLKEIFNRFNLRASYGVNGNISLNNTPYLILSVGSYDSTMGGVSYGISSYPNNQLRWEKTAIYDFGLDFSMFDNRFNASLDLYHKKSTDLIVSESIDQTRGVSTLPQNVGGVTNKGFEVTLSADVVKTNDFLWNSTLISSYNTSNVDSYNVTRTYLSSIAMATPVLVKGYPMDGIWGPRFAGLNDKGVCLYYDSEGNKVEGGTLKAKDAVYLGTLKPKLDMSWTNSFRYKNVEASFMFIAKFGQVYRKDCFSGSNYNNRHVGERWKQAGDEAKTIYPVLKSWNMDMFRFPYSDVLVGKANYVKLRDFTLGYYIPSQLVRGIGLSSVKVYFQTRNLFYIASKGCDIDPETAEINESGGTGAMTSQAFTSLQLRPEFYFGASINF